MWPLLTGAIYCVVLACGFQVVTVWDVDVLREDGNLEAVEVCCSPWACPPRGVSGAVFVAVELLPRN